MSCTYFLIAGVFVVTIFIRIIIEISFANAHGILYNKDILMKQIIEMKGAAK